MTFWIVNILNGVSLAMILFLLASGLTLVFGLMRIVNMVHGSFYLLGGYIALSVMQGSGYFVLGAVVSFVLVAALGMGIQRMFLSKLYKQELPQALLTLGLLFVFADVAFWIWGGNPVMLPQPALFSGTVRVFGIPYPTYRLFLIGVGLGLALLLWLFLENTKIGAAVRAGIDDEEMLRGIGINVPLLFACVFALGAGLAGLGGVLGGPLLGVFPGADFEVVLLAFVVVTVGGLGSIQGAFWASLLVGLADNFGECLVSAAVAVHDLSADDCGPRGAADRSDGARLRCTPWSAGSSRSVSFSCSPLSSPRCRPIRLNWSRRCSSMQYLR
jgi:branched-chain amino acid transport system permease protein